METEDQEEQLKSADVEELKPDRLDAAKFSQKGFCCSYFSLVAASPSSNPLLPPYWSAGVEGGEMEAQQQDEEDERPKDRHQPVEEERAERGRESSIHTVPELLLHPVQVG